MQERKETKQNSKDNELLDEKLTATLEVNKTILVWGFFLADYDANWQDGRFGSNFIHRICNDRVLIRAERFQCDIERYIMLDRCENIDTMSWRKTIKLSYYTQMVVLDNDEQKIRQFDP